MKYIKILTACLMLSGCMKDGNALPTATSTCSLPRPKDTAILRSAKTLHLLVEDVIVADCDSDGSRTVWGKVRYVDTVRFVALRLRHAENGKWYIQSDATLVDRSLMDLGTSMPPVTYTWIARLRRQGLPNGVRVAVDHDEMGAGIPVKPNRHHPVAQPPNRDRIRRGRDGLDAIWWLARDPGDLFCGELGRRENGSPA